jgi:ABC-type multidrug transport system fused ATPase/permease subunit
LQEQEYSKRLDMKVGSVCSVCPPYRRQLAILIGQMFLLGLVDAVMPLFNRYAIDKIALTGRLERLIPFGLIALAVIVLQALNVRLMILYAGRLECFIPYDIRKAAFARLQTMPWPITTRRRSAGCWPADIGQPPARRDLVLERDRPVLVAGHDDPDDGLHAAAQCQAGPDGPRDRARAGSGQHPVPEADHFQFPQGAQV